MLKAVRYLFQNTKGLWVRFGGFIFLMLLNMFVAYQTPFKIKDFTESLTARSGVEEVMMNAALVAILVISAYVVKWLIMILRTDTATLLALNTRRLVYRNILNDVDIQVYRTKGASYYTQVLVNDVIIVSASFEQIVTIVAESIGALLTVVALFKIQWQLALVVLLGIPLYWLVVKYFNGIAARKSVVLFEAMKNSTKSTNEWIFGMLDLRVNKGLLWMREKFAAIQHTFRQALVELSLANCYSTAFVQAIVTVTQVLVVWVGIKWLGIRPVSLSTLVAFLGTMGNMYQPLITWSSQLSTIQRSATGFQRISEMVVPALRQKESKIDTREVVLSLENIYFSHEADRGLLLGVNLRLEPDEWVMLYGPSGSGKSTLMEIAGGLLKTMQGRVLLNHQELERIAQQSLHEVMAVVTEEIYLLEASIYENVAYTLPVDKVAIRDLLREVQLDELLADEDFCLKRDGSNLSVGQKQKLAIARALYRNPRILLLDEPTSAMDYESEQAVIEALKRRDELAVLIVTHRTNLVKYADRVLKVWDGELVEEAV